MLSNIHLLAASILPTRFRVNWPSVQETKGKIDFHQGGHLGFAVRPILAFFIFKLPRYFLPIFESVGHLRSGEEAQNRFSR